MRERDLSKDQQDVLNSVRQQLNAHATGRTNVALTVNPDASVSVCVGVFTGTTQWLWSETAPMSELDSLRTYAKGMLKGLSFLSASVEYPGYYYLTELGAPELSALNPTVLPDTVAVGELAAAVDALRDDSAICFQGRVCIRRKGPEDETVYNFYDVNNLEHVRGYGYTMGAALDWLRYSEIAKHP